MSMAILEEEGKSSGPRTFLDPATCVKKGFCPARDIPRSPFVISHSIYYEIHGSGPERLVFVMGLSFSSLAWMDQVRHFGKHEKYSVLVFDNRGAGHSDAPKGPYTTSAMAEDVVTLLNYVRWNDRRQLHVVGMSMGGMIAMELATRIPGRIASLSLISTTPGWRDLWKFPSLRISYLLLRALAAKKSKEKGLTLLEALFPSEYLLSPVPGSSDGRTGLEVQETGFISRCAVAPPQRPIGTFSQLAAVMTHYISPRRLASIASSIPKVLILTGDVDPLVDPSNSYYMKEQMKGSGDVELVVWGQTSHLISGQWPERFNKIIERVCEEGREKAAFL
ncbi:alpha/beta-hydrolase [Cantharellus anzutake]|uniref:alpha/beta-hydrolase n=1 Tax=Cantharellus anzutake TaxID=1750568 RepID=UPI001908CC09|nr:alpha/beta-hydrolase [Cantharellus anzutake]KAF8337502.1 alpha/beta-hydrolase [Cantharellus anzutake]